MKISPNEDEWIKIEKAIRTAITYWEYNDCLTEIELEQYQKIHKAIDNMIKSEKFMSKRSENYRK